MKRHIKRLIITILSCLFIFGLTNAAKAAVIFSDNFDSGASPEWGNERGNWTTLNGAYFATNPSETSDLYSISSINLPGSLTHYQVDVDIIRTDHDFGVNEPARAREFLGGILLNVSDNQDGLRFVVHYDAVFWQTRINGVWSIAYNYMDVSKILGVNPHLTIKVLGDTYEAYINDIFISSFQTSQFGPGGVALTSQHVYDNFVISDFSPAPAPEPSSIVLGLISLAGAVGLRKRNREETA